MLQGLLGGDAAGRVQSQQAGQQVVPRVRQRPHLLIPQRRRGGKLVPQLVVWLLRELYLYEPPLTANEPYRGRISFTMNCGDDGIKASTALLVSPTE